MTTTLPLPLKELLRRIEAQTEKTPSCWLWRGAFAHRPGKTPLPLLRVMVNGDQHAVSVRKVV